MAQQGEQGDQFAELHALAIEGGFVLRGFQFVAEWAAMIFLGALGEADQVARFETPVGRGDDPGAGDVVAGDHDQAEPSE